jgi:hypothetical protein
MLEERGGHDVTGDKHRRGGRYDEKRHLSQTGVEPLAKLARTLGVFADDARHLGSSAAEIDMPNSETGT